MQMVLDVFGWIGMVLLALAYLLNSSGKIGVRSMIYQGMNTLGAFFVAVQATTKEAWPAVGIEVVWILIGIVSVINILRGRADTEDTS